MAETISNTKEILQLVIDYIIPAVLILFAVITCSGFFKWLGHKADTAHDWYVETATKIERNIVAMCECLDKLWVKILSVVLAVAYILLTYYV